jgi:hypothetical protein
MHKDFPQKGEKERTVHSVQAVTDEDMGINVPRIYASLDNKQDEFQSHMIEVKGNINDQPIAILIDSRASHSYLDPPHIKVEFSILNLSSRVLMCMSFSSPSCLKFGCSWKTFPPFSLSLPSAHL